MTLEWWQALLLGALQGGTEFLPVSSSGHLVFAPFLLAWSAPGLAFDAAVHGGTAGALVAAFRSELAAMVRGLVGGGGVDARLARRLAGLLVVGTLPLVAVALAASEVVGTAFGSPPAAATGFLATAAILLGGERWRSQRVARAAHTSDRAADADTPVGPNDGIDGRAGEAADARSSSEAREATDAVAPPSADVIGLGTDAEDPRGVGLDGLTLRVALLIGVSQAVAVLPGVSRSGTTIMAGVVCGLTREAATRFAFLLALPALGGAVALSAVDLAAEGAGTLGWPALAGAVGVSLVTGLAAIRWLLRLVARTRLSGFAVYCAAAGVAGWLAVLTLGGS